MATNYEYVKGQTDASQAGFYSPAGPPANGTNGDTMGWSEGSGAITTLLNSITGANFASMTFRSGFKADLGDGNNPFYTNVVGTLSFGGSNRVNYFAGGSATGVIASMVWDPANGLSAGYFSGITFTGTVYVFSGYVELNSSCAVVDIETAKSGQLLVKEHASDLIGNSTIGGSSTAEFRRRASGTTSVEEGATLIYDVDTATSSGVITLNGGTVIHKKGALSIKGRGVYDYSKLEKVYAVTIVDQPGMIEKFGPVPPTFSRTTIGAGSAKIPG